MLDTIEKKRVKILGARDVTRLKPLLWLPSSVLVVVWCGCRRLWVVVVVTWSMLKESLFILWHGNKSRDMSAM